MSCGPTSVKFQLRRGTFTEWFNSNPRLLNGEPAYDTTNNCLKIGDGTTLWQALPYLTSCNGPSNYLSLGNVLRVDDVYGNDIEANASAPYFTVPFKTVTAAIEKVTSGQTIWIMPGIYTLNSGVLLPDGCSIRGVSLQTTIIQMTDISENTTLLTMGENCRVEDLTLRIITDQHYTLKGIVFGGTTTSTSKLRTCVVTIDNSSAIEEGKSDVYCIECNGSENPSTSSFSFNSLKGSTLNVFSNGGGNKRGILVSGSNVVTTRDLNIYVAKPRAVGFEGFYVGVETNDPAEIGSIQMRATTVGVIPPADGELYTASDILQTRPLFIDNPAYLESPGIQLGPGVDLITKTAGSRPFSTYVYPTTLYYGLKGDLKVGGSNEGYIWPGTQLVTNNTFPDPDLASPAFYRVQQPFILSGMIVFMKIAPGLGNTVTINVRRTPYGGSITDVTNFSLTFTDGETFKSYYNSSQRFGPRDLIHVRIVLSRFTTTEAHDITVQLDCF